MKSIRKPALWAAVALLVAAGAVPAAHADTTTFKLALSTGPNHVRNIMLEGFIEKLRERTRNRLDVEVFPANQLFKGPDVPEALAQGTLEMGVPGLWQLGRFDPNALAPDLPIFYGATRDEIHAVWDGPIGDELRSRLEKKMRVKVIGKFLDLGYGTIFTTEKQIRDSFGPRRPQAEDAAGRGLHRALQGIPDEPGLDPVRRRSIGAGAKHRRWPDVDP